MSKYVKYNTVLIIQSLNAGEKFTGTALHDDILKLRCEQRDFNCILINVSNTSEFIAALNSLQKNVEQGHIFPLIHLEMHGSKDGLHLANNECITWENLAVICRNINIASRNNLIVTVSACMGAYIFKLVDINYPAPYFGFIGPNKDMYPDELYEDYYNFFNALLTSDDLGTALDALVQTRKKDYTFYTSEKMFEIACNAVKNHYVESNSERFHRLKNQTKATSPQLNRASRRKKLKENIQNHNRLKFMADLKAKFLMLKM